MNIADHRAVLKRVALVFVAYALVEGAVFAYCIANRINFGSSIGTAGLLAAFFLWRGSLRTAAIVRWGALFLAAACVPSLFVWPQIVPLDLWVAFCRHRTVTALVVGGYLTTMLGLCVWAARETGRASVTAARIAAGRKPIDRRYPLAFGTALGLGIAFLIALILNGSTATEAERQTAEHYGTEYRYRTIGLSGFYFVDDSVVFASVAMWNDRELKVIEGPMIVR